MNNTTFPNNIRRYILGEEDGDDMNNIDEFEITKFDYRKIFSEIEHQHINHLEMVSKFFGIEKLSDVDLKPQSQKFYFDEHSDEWKELFIFFCVMPFTEYEFQGKDGELINPNSLHNVCPSKATDNLLIGTFSDIEFNTLKQEISDNRLGANLQRILSIDIFSKTFNEDQRKKLIKKLLNVGFHLDYNLVNDLPLTDEDTYKFNFRIYLFTPICEFIALLLITKIEVRNKNTVGLTGVHTRVPHATNDLFHSHPDMVAYVKKIHSRSLALVEVKKLALLKSDKC